MDELDGFEIEEGNPETWEEFAERMQRHVGNGARVFVCRQVGVSPPLDEPRAAQSKPATFIMILRSGHIREDLVAEVFK